MVYIKNLLEIPLYIEQLKASAALPINWNKIDGKTFLISGATGMIGSYLVDLLMYRNINFNSDITIIALGRSEKKAAERFHMYFNHPNFIFQIQDVNNELSLGTKSNYILHFACTAHPLSYSTDPIGTITANVIGLKNLLDYAVSQKKHSRSLFLSSGDIYGKNSGNIDKFDETYSGYIDCNTLRAGYSESKRVGEALCQAYISAKKLDIVIARLSHAYGPTMQGSDSKAVAQFIKKAVNSEDIILKSDGTQFYSYTYVADAVSAILYLLLYGKSGEAYNIASENSDITLKELAGKLASLSNSNVIFEIPDEIESKGYTPVTKAILSNDKIMKLGWKSNYDISSGIKSTYEILKSDII